MPKVGTWIERIGQKDRYDIYYSSKDGFTLKGIPEEFYAVVGGKPAPFRTEGELKTWYLDARRKYEEFHTKKELVILYSIEAPTNKTMNSEGYGSYTGVQQWIPHAMSRKIQTMDGNYDFGFGVYWRICYKITKANQSIYYEKERLDAMQERTGSQYYGHGDLKREEEFEIPWTEANESFFKALEGKVDEIMKSLAKFFFKGEGHLLERVATGNLLFPTPEEVK